MQKAVTGFSHHAVGEDDFEQKGIAMADFLCDADAKQQIFMRRFFG